MDDGESKESVNQFGDRAEGPGCPIGEELVGYGCCGTASPAYMGYGTTPIPDIALMSCHCV